MDGLIYLLNQAGLALAQANARIAELQVALAEAQAALNRGGEPGATEADGSQQ